MRAVEDTGRSFRPSKGSEEPRAPDDPVNLTVNLLGERRCNDTHQVDHRPGRYTG